MAEWSNSPKPWVRRGLIVDGSNIRAVLARVQIQVCLREAEGWLGVGNRHQPVSRPAPGLARPGKDWMTTLEFQALRDMQFTGKRAPLACADGPQLLATPAPTQRYFFKRTKWTDRGAGCAAAGSRRRGVAAGFLLAFQEPLQVLPARSIVSLWTASLILLLLPPARRSRSRSSPASRSSFQIQPPRECRAPGFV